MYGCENRTTLSCETSPNCDYTPLVRAISPLGVRGLLAFTRRNLQPIRTESALDVSRACGGSAKTRKRRLVASSRAKGRGVLLYARGLQMYGSFWTEGGARTNLPA